MQAEINVIDTQNITKPMFEQAAVDYLHQTLGDSYRLGKSHQLPDGKWRFLILFNSVELTSPYTVGVLQIDRTGHIIPFTDDQCKEIMERAMIAVANTQCDLPMQNGYISKVFAQRVANLYLSESVGFFFIPIEGTLVLSERPLWRFSIQFRLPRSGDLGVIGDIDVDAQTGELISLTAQKISEIQKRANAIARYQT